MSETENKVKSQLILKKKQISFISTVIPIDNINQYLIEILKIAHGPNLDYQHYYKLNKFVETLNIRTFSNTQNKNAIHVLLNKTGKPRKTR